MAAASWGIRRGKDFWLNFDGRWHSVEEFFELRRVLSLTRKNLPYSSYLKN
jgi:hypothetical protein